MFLGDDRSVVASGMPSTARLQLSEQPAENRYVLHLLYANTILRGGTMDMQGGSVRVSRPVEVIEELMPLRGVQVSVAVPREVRKITLEPRGLELPLKAADGRILIGIDEFTCHEMVVLHY
jgi:hypothetical protein